VLLNFKTVFQKRGFISLYKMYWFRIGCLSMASAVALGAFGAHALKSSIKDEKLLKTWDTAVQYHFIHSLALLAIPSNHIGPRGLWGIRLLSAGILLFSGSLYLLVLSGKKSLGAITPIGGVAFILGWIFLATAF
jgi:uncharacterized membrane protein YgdD (TMEM256/DUF423 family)